MNVDITYRGELASCNYDCSYCPFAKTVDSAQTRQNDKAALKRLVDWARSRQGIDRLRFLFTPWGEALVRKWYRDTIVELSLMPHVDKVVIQTNLSTPTDFIETGEKSKIALWCTYHPSQTSINKFINATSKLDAMGVSYSVGMVGLKEYQPIITELRQRLPADKYLWINAYKDEKDYYNEPDIEFFNRVDPWFSLNLTDYASLGKSCRAGCQSISVDGDGQVKMCHFVDKELGNLYQQDLHQILKPQQLCPNTKCDCYIGYIHLDELQLTSVYGDRLLERIPVQYNFP